MSVYSIQNTRFQAEIESFGAELRSLKNNNETEYLWSADPQYWKRVSPVLFPFVGKTNGLHYRTGGKEYPMTPHGFARDREFALLEQKEDEIWFVLEADDQSREIYPFEFRLELGYKLNSKGLEVLWKVINPASTDLYFAIGGHPAFLCPPGGAGSYAGCYLHFDTDAPTLHCTAINENGLALPGGYDLPLSGGYLPLTETIFDHDALVIENRQCKHVSLCLPNKTPYLAVSFEAPLFGIWSPPGKQAPFVCIEPWYGRSDSLGFTGDLTERAWENHLEGHGVFEASYTILPLK